MKKKTKNNPSTFGPTFRDMTNFEQEVKEKWKSLHDSGNPIAFGAFIIIARYFYDLGMNDFKDKIAEEVKHFRP